VKGIPSAPHHTTTTPLLLLCPHSSISIFDSQWAFPNNNTLYLPDKCVSVKKVFLCPDPIFGSVKVLIIEFVCVSMW